jgi:hypothetical protein
VDETRKTAEHELEALRSREEYVRELEAGRDALLDSLEPQAPEALDSLTPEQLPVVQASRVKGGCLCRRESGDQLGRVCEW